MLAEAANATNTDRSAVIGAIQRAASGFQATIASQSAGVSAAVASGY